MLLQVLQQRTAGAMHDAFGHAGRAGGEQDEQRVLEGQALEGDVLASKAASASSIDDGVRHGGGRLPRGAEIVDHDGLRTLGSFARIAWTFADVVLLAVVPVAVRRDEDDRLDLAEAVEHALFAEVRRAGRPDGADRGGGEHAGDGLRHVGHHRRDAVALLHAERAGKSCCRRETA